VPLPERIRRFGKSVHWWISLAYYLHWILQIASGTALLAAVLSLFTKHYKLAAILGAVALAAIVCARFVSQRRKAKYLNRDLTFNAYEAVYKFNPERTQASLVVRTTVEANRTVDHIKYKFRWTGSGPAKILPKTGISTIEGPLADVGGHWDLYRLCFPEPLQRGQSRKVEFRIDAQDLERTVRPHLSMFTNDHFQCVLLRVILPIALPVEVYKLVLPHIGAADAEFREAAEVDEFTGEIRWEISKVQSFKVYQINWRIVA
jgi:hypothetical protein